MTPKLDLNARAVVVCPAHKTPREGIMRSFWTIAAVLACLIVAQAAEAGPIRYVRGKAIGGAKRVKSAAGVVCRGGRCG